MPDPCPMPGSTRGSGDTLDPRDPPTVLIDRECGHPPYGSTRSQADGHPDRATDGRRHSPADWTIRGIKNGLKKLGRLWSPRSGIDMLSNAYQSVVMGHPSATAVTTGS